MREWLFKRRLAKTRKFIKTLDNEQFISLVRHGLDSHFLPVNYLKSLSVKCLRGIMALVREEVIKEIVHDFGLGFIHKAPRRRKK